MTFNSRADGFDDKQEVDFFCERDAVVSVALDARLSLALPSFIAEFTVTGESLLASDGREYLLFEKTYSAGSHIHIPGICGDCNHFVVLARPAAVEEKKRLPETPVLGTRAAPYQKRTYRSHLVEVFNDENALSRFSCRGCTLTERDGNPRDRFVRMQGEASLKKELTALSSRVVLTAKISCISGVLSRRFLRRGRRTLRRRTEWRQTLHDGRNLHRALRARGGNSSSACARHRSSENTTFGQTAVCFAGQGCSRTARRLPYPFPATGKVRLIIFMYSTTPSFTLHARNLIRDRRRLVGGNAECQCVPEPFDDDPSLSLSSSDGKDAYTEYLFPAVSGILSVETKVRAHGTGLVLVPEMTDENGTPACRIALYKNCLFATDGDDWVEIYEGLTDWQYYPAGNWYQIKVTLDTDRSVYTLMVDGAVRAVDFRFIRSVKSVSRLVFSVQGGERLLVGRIRIYDAADFSPRRASRSSGI